VARALSRIPLPESTDAILRLARDPIWFVRLRALAALGQVRASSAESVVLDRLQDEVREVRFRAAAPLRQIRGMKGEIVREVLATRPRLSFDSLISEWERAGFLWEVVAGLSTRDFSRFVES
jgi:HEAT repeat protein